MGEPARSRGRATLSLLVGTAALAAVVAIALHFGDARAFVALLARADPSWLLVALASESANHFVKASVWRSVWARRGSPPPLPWLAGVSVLSTFASATVPSAGLAGTWLVLRMLRLRGAQAPVAVAAVVVDTVGHYGAYGIFVAWALSMLWGLGQLPEAVLWMATAVVGFALALLLLIVALPDRLDVPRWLPSELHAPDRALIRSPSLIATAIALRGTNFALDVATLWSCLAAVGVQASWGGALAALMVGALARTVGIVPSGLGTFEAATVGGLRLFGIPLEPALAAALLFRGFTFWLVLPPGFWLSRHMLREVEEPA